MFNTTFVTNEQLRLMKLALRFLTIPALMACIIGLSSSTALGLGGDHPNDQKISEPSWPAGMTNLVNITNRIGGLWVNEADTFFYNGTATNFTAFLDDYAKMEGIQQHVLIVHAGAGEAFSLGGGNKRPCDWRLDGMPAAWRNLSGPTANAANTNYVLEVHFWTGGKIALDQLAIPKNVEISKDK
jgi:hypothetical protein